VTAPSWAPTVDKVANYVPGRTLAVPPGAPTGTFTTGTTPTAVQVTALIADGCEWVTVVTGGVDSTLEGMAAATAAVYAACQVERGFPDRNADVNTAEQLWQQAQSMRADLDAANKALTGTDATDPSGAVSFVYGFPAAPSWADLDL
jgi:hypothetical protein